LEILVCTRFSFRGLSGWQSDFAADPEKLFARERLEARLLLLRAITLPSLATQDTQSFHHYLLTSSDLPDWALEALNAACLAAYGTADRFSIRAEPWGNARRHLRAFMTDRYGTEPVAQVVLDDDDGLGAGFMADLAGRLARIEGEVATGTRTLPYFISYPYGLALNFGESGLELYRHSYEFINLGLTMIGTPEDKNIFSIDHLSAPKRFGVEIVDRKLMFLRSVHGFNDSRVEVTHRWIREDDWHENPRLIAAMPFLSGIAAALG
jgi:hypothetical protein